MIPRVLRRRDRDASVNSRESIPLPYTSAAANGSINSSDIDSREESLKYVFLLRLLASIDVTMLLYRSALSLLPWYYFFRVGNAGGLFSAAYLFMKTTDISSRINDVIVVISNFTSGKLVLQSQFVVI